MRKPFEEDELMENRLRSLPLKPVPDGLREKILGAAKAERSKRAWTTPLLRAGLAGTAAALAAIILFSALSDRSQTAHLQALTDGHRTVQTELEQEWALEMENLGDLLGPAELAREKRILAHRRMAPHPPAASTRNSTWRNSMAKTFRKILTKTLLGLLLLAAAVLIVRAVLNSTTGHRLTKYLETTKAEGLPLRVKDLVPACPDSDNAAVQWKAAEALFQVDRGDMPLLTKTITGFFQGGPIEAADRVRLTALTEKHRTLINLIAEAGTRSCFRYGDWGLRSYEVSQPKFVVMVQAIRLLAIDSVLRADRGEVPEALGQCLKGMRFIRLIADEPLLINILVALADMRILMSAVNQILQDRPVAPEILTSWIAELDPLPWRARFLRFLPGERANMLEMGLDLINGKASVITGAKKPGIFRRFYYWLIRPVLKAECLWMMKHWDGYTNMDTRSYWQMRDFLAQKSLEAAHPPWYFKMIGALLPELHSVFYKEAMLEAMMLATRTGLAAKLYQAQTKRFPESLEALVPGMFKEVPIDPFTGKPYVFKVQNGELLIYSLGSNLKDDGGRMTYMITQLVMDKDDDWTWRERIK